MKLLIASTEGKLRSLKEFAETLTTLGVEIIFIRDKDYYALSDFKILKHIPFPKLLTLIKRFNPDFIFTNAPYYTAFIVKLVNRPLLVHLRGDMWTESHWNRTLYPFSSPHRMIHEWQTSVMLRGIKKADLILPLSKWLETKVKQHLQTHPTHVLYKAIDPIEWSPRRDMPLFNLQRPAIVGVFDFEIYPKVVGLLKFIKSVRKMRDAFFYFAGNGPYVNLIRRNRPSNMFLLGRLTRSGVRNILASADVFVHPSGLEALGTCVMEAALMERPIVASDVGGIPEVVKDNETGYLCDLNDTDQWIERIRFLLHNPNTAKMLGKEARKYVIKKFDWKRITRDFLRKIERKTTW